MKEHWKSIRYFLHNIIILNDNKQVYRRMAFCKLTRWSSGLQYNVVCRSVPILFWNVGKSSDRLHSVITWMTTVVVAVLWECWTLLRTPLHPHHRQLWQSWSPRIHPVSQIGSCQSLPLIPHHSGRLNDKRTHLLNYYLSTFCCSHWAESFKSTIYI